MSKISKEMVRRRAEHNDGLIYTLEELSLHQMDIEKIENIDLWCPNLKILYLQGNLISKIENIGKFKRLTYLNLAMNNISLIENLSGCESLIKLDLTVNFIQKLSSIGELKENYNLKELYLMGNPCAKYDNYRLYVVIILSNLNFLDGMPIQRPERIIGLQNFQTVKNEIIKQETISNITENEIPVQNDNNDDDDETFWTKKSIYTPESRFKMHHHLQQLKQDQESSLYSMKNKQKPERKLTNKDGQLLNINEPKVNFNFYEEDDYCLILNVEVYRYLDTSLIEIDVQPNYVKIFIKQKLLQLVLESEVKPDQSIIQRSQTTGHLIIKMPKVNGTLVPIVKNEPRKCSQTQSVSITDEDVTIPELI